MFYTMSCTNVHVLVSASNLHKFMFWSFRCTLVSRLRQLLLATVTSSHRVHSPCEVTVLTSRTLSCPTSSPASVRFRWWRHARETRSNLWRRCLATNWKSLKNLWKRSIPRSEVGGASSGENWVTRATIIQVWIGVSCLLLQSVAKLLETGWKPRAVAGQSNSWRHGGLLADLCEPGGGVARRGRSEEGEGAGEREPLQVRAGIHSPVILQYVMNRLVVGTRNKHMELSWRRMKWTRGKWGRCFRNTMRYTRRYLSVFFSFSKCPVL